VKERIEQEMAARIRTKVDENPSADVDAFMRNLEHPLKDVLEAVRRLILGADKKIVEGIKWNAPSFRVSEYFATTNISPSSIRVVLHLGAKVRNNGPHEMQIDDSAGILKWLAKDRCVATFSDLGSVKKRQAAFQSVIRQWITYL
jgi:hypothetical protein